MNTELSHEQIEQNAAAYIAAKGGKPWQRSRNGVYWDDANKCSIEDCLANGDYLRPAPEHEPPKPWDIKTCPPLPFEVVTKSRDVRTMVCAATNIAGYTYFYGLIYWEDLLRDFTMPDGSPCGVTP